MAHILGKLKGVNFFDVEKSLRSDAKRHAEKGLTLEHAWRNADKQDEVFFLFKTDDLQRAKRFVKQVHEQARLANPNINLPEMVFLE